jgi:BTB/POZ domain/MATH domain
VQIILVGRQQRAATTMMKIATLGTPTELSPVVTLRFEIHGFAKLKETKGQYVTPPSLSAHGFDWTINLYPRGDSEASEEGHVSCDLRLIDEDLETDAVVEAEFDLKFGAGVPRERVNATFSKNEPAWSGHYWFMEREELLNKDNRILLPNGTLIIDVELQVYVEKRAVWYPPIPNGDTQLLADLLETGRGSDVTFRIGQQDFHLHSLILEKRAPVLFQMIEEHPEQTIITLEDDEEEEDAARPVCFALIAPPETRTRM